MDEPEGFAMPGCGADRDALPQGQSGGHGGLDSGAAVFEPFVDRDEGDGLGVAHGRGVAGSEQYGAERALQP